MADTLKPIQAEQPTAVLNYFSHPRVWSNIARQWAWNYFAGTRVWTTLPETMDIDIQHQKPRHSKWGHTWALGNALLYAIYGVFLGLPWWPKEGPLNEDVKSHRLHTNATVGACNVAPHSWDPRLRLPRKAYDIRIPRQTVTSEAHAGSEVWCQPDSW